eukprot:scaffold4996_cov82-Skeletonema_dohrnii-CCMP3373.AAC.1
MSRACSELSVVATNGDDNGHGRHHAYVRKINLYFNRSMFVFLSESGIEKISPWFEMVSLLILRTSGLEEDSFPIQTSMEEENKENRFKTGEVREDHKCSTNGVDWSNKKDVYTLICIRSATLDAMWSKKKSTVEKNASRMQLDLKNAQKVLSFGPLFPKMGNPCMEDKVGMGVALVTSHTSLRPGKNAWHLQ